MARILITCGPTRERLDPVRYLSNRSSGRTGLAIAAEALARGHQVDLVLGPVELPPPSGARVVPVVTCEEMLAACLSLHPRSEAVIGAAAVSDFRPAVPLDQKRPRRGGSWSIDLVPNPDILHELSRQKGSRVHAGFALETGSAEEALERAREKLIEKDLDWIVLNSPEALGGEGASYHLLGRSGPAQALGRLSKHALARRLLDAIENSLKGSDCGADKNR
jgi:phosphopantothenoylcysteine decarboxylase/phosphopantothenate--cysteine ligase